MSDEEVPPLSQTDVEPAPFRLQGNIPSHAGDPACILIPSRSLTSSLRTPPIAKSRTNSIVQDEIEHYAINDPIIL
jgi:hypothetical protein